jgi:hypothetical protein
VNYFLTFCEKILNITDINKTFFNNNVLKHNVKKVFKIFFKNLRVGFNLAQAYLKGTNTPAYLAALTKKKREKRLILFVMLGASPSL